MSSWYKIGKLSRLDHACTTDLHCDGYGYDNGTMRFYVYKNSAQIVQVILDEAARLPWCSSFLDPLSDIGTIVDGKVEKEGTEINVDGVDLYHIHHLICLLRHTNEFHWAQRACTMEGEEKYGLRYRLFFHEMYRPHGHCFWRTGSGDDVQLANALPLFLRPELYVPYERYVLDYKADSGLKYLNNRSSSVGSLHPSGDAVIRKLSGLDHDKDASSTLLQLLESEEKRLEKILHA